MPKRRTKIDRQITSWVNSLTDEQMKQIYQHIDPMTEAERAELDAMSDDDLLRELKS